MRLYKFRGVLRSMNFTESAALLLPITDVVSITVASNWTQVCRHVHAYLNELCEALSALNCQVLSVGATRCYKNICICRDPAGDRRVLLESTEIVASVDHYHALSNQTQLPPWVTALTVVDTDPDANYWLLGISCLFALGSLCVAACIVRTCKRYLGYQKIEMHKK